MKKTAYLAGKVSGQFEKAAIDFSIEQCHLEANNYIVLNPLVRNNDARAELEMTDYGAKAAGKPHWRRMMKACLHDLLECDELWLIKGWEDSVGARIEAMTALIVGIPVFECGSGKEVTHIKNLMEMSAVV